MSENEQVRALQVIYEVIRRSTADAVEGKTRMFKAFYFAHLFHLEKTGRLLSGWPIVRMPNGPGIDRFPHLINELAGMGLIEIEHSHVGPFRSYNYKLTGGEPPEDWSALDSDATDAIRNAVAFVANKTGAQLSDITHEFSRSWLNSEDGETMNIYEDLVDDEAYQRETAMAQKLETEIQHAWS